MPYTQMRIDALSQLQPSSVSSSEGTATEEDTGGAQTPVAVASGRVRVLEGALSLLEQRTLAQTHSFLGSAGCPTQTQPLGGDTLAASNTCFHGSFQQRLITLPQGPGNRVPENPLLRGPPGRHMEVKGLAQRSTAWKLQGCSHHQSQGILSPDEQGKALREEEYETHRENGQTWGIFHVLVSPADNDRVPTPPSHASSSSLPLRSKK